MGRIWLIISVLINALLLSLLAWPHSRKVSSSSPPASSALSLPTPASLGSNVVVRRQNFTWQEVESGDYTSYLKNLRDIGCPEPTIRDIIIADVNQLYSHKRDTEGLVGNQEWWRTEPSPNSPPPSAERLALLDAERRALLTRLLGPNWEVPSAAIASAQFIRAGNSLIGPLLGDLPPETKQRVNEITAQAQSRIEGYLRAQSALGQEPDPSQVARLRQQTRTELSQVLSPPQMEEFLLRYSKTAQDLRREMAGITLSPEQFRELFRARDSLDQQGDLYANETAAGSIRAKQSLEIQRDNVLQRVLGPEQYQLYKISRDPIYAETRATAQQIGVPEQTVLPLYQINRISDLERARIMAEGSLTEEQKAAALNTIDSEERQSLDKLLGTELSRRFWQQRQQ